MSLVFGDTYERRVRKNAKGEPIYVVESADGSQKVLTGWEGEVAAKAAKEPLRYKFNHSPEVQDVLIKMNPDDPRNNSLRYKLGRLFDKISRASADSTVGRILDKGLLAGGALGAGVGFTGGALANIITDKLGYPIPVNLGLLGALGLGGLGAIIGHGRKQLRQKYPFIPSDQFVSPAELYRFHASPEVPAFFMKRAAMYNNPRNFILEKLQADNSIGFAEKAKLTASVRNLSVEEAEQLKSLVREALGLNVSTIISRYLFNRDHAGSLFGGLIAFLGKDFSKTLINK